MSDSTGFHQNPGRFISVMPTAKSARKSVKRFSGKDAR
jgi:hypothetical protein